tara:strand:- start:2775 stop:3392 length:618 start_codon:yes stop_codon:yes gene_type:complete
LIFHLTGKFAMNTINDFFFGQIDNSNTLRMPLSPVVAKGNLVTPKYFTYQLNRLLKTHNNHVILYCDTSSPAFPELMSMLPHEEIGLIEIYAKTDVNEMMNATLACDIFLENGVVSVVPHWCAYKEIRSREIVSTLLVPLIKNNAYNKSFIREGGKKYMLPRENNELLNKIFSLSRYPHAGLNLDITECINSLNIAKEECDINLD